VASRWKTTRGRRATVSLAAVWLAPLALAACTGGNPLYVTGVGHPDAFSSDLTGSGPLASLPPSTGGAPGSSPPGGADAEPSIDPPAALPDGATLETGSIDVNDPGSDLGPPTPPGVDTSPLPVNDAAPPPVVDAGPPPVVDASSPPEAPAEVPPPPPPVVDAAPEVSPPVLMRGLRGVYFEGRNFDTQVLERVDQLINFAWGSGSPATGLPVDNFSVRWTGFIEPRQSGLYYFHTENDDGVRLTVGGVPVISAWADQTAGEHDGSVALVAGVRSPIELEYYERAYTATMRLSWQGPGFVREIVPPAALSTP
jgi:hypothetical protein